MGPTATTRTTTRTALLRLAAALAGTVNAACARALALRPPLPPTLLHRGEAAAALQTRALSVAVLPAAHPAAGAAGRPKCSVITSAAEPLQSVRLASTNSDFVETASIGGTISSPAANPANGDVANAEKKRRTPQRLATMKFFYMKTMLETRKNVKGAKKQLQKMEAEGIPINSSHLSLIAAFYAREGKWRQALEWFTAVHRRGIPWQCLAATTVMSECAERNEWDKVEQLFQHFLSTGALPDEALLDSMIGIAANQGDFIRATFWYFRFAEFNLRPPHRVYKSRILSLLSPGRHNGGKPDSRDVETAVKILDEIEAVDWSRDGVDEVSWCLPYVHIMRAHSRMKHLDRVQEVFERCCKQWPDRNPPALLHEALITALAAGGDWEFARARLDSVASRSHSDDPKRNQLRPKVYAQFLEKAASDEEERRYVEAATRAAAVLQSEQLDEILVPSLIIGRLARGDTKGAKRLFIEKQPPKVDPVDQWELSLDGKGPKGMLFDVWDSSKVLFACKQLTPPALAVSEATAWFELLSERDPTLKSNVHFWTRFIGVAAEAPPKPIIDLLEDMRASGATPNDVTYLVALEACESAIDVAIDSARENTDEAAAAQIAEHNRVLNLVVEYMRKYESALTERHWTVLMSVACKLRDWDRVDDIWKILRRGGGSVRAPGPLKAAAAAATLASDAPAFTTQQPSLHYWRVPEATASVYLDSLGLRRDLDGLVATFNELARTKPRVIPARVPTGESPASPSSSSPAATGTWPPSVLTENHCNSYAEALIYCGRGDLAADFVQSWMGVPNTPAAWCYPTEKTLASVVGGLMSAAAAEQRPRQELLDLARRFSEWFKRRWGGVWVATMRSGRLRGEMKTLGVSEELGDEAVADQDGDLTLEKDSNL